MTHACNTHPDTPNTRARAFSRREDDQSSSRSHGLLSSTSAAAVSISLLAFSATAALAVFITKNKTSRAVSCPSFTSLMYLGHPLFPAGYTHRVGVVVPVP